MLGALSRLTAAELRRRRLAAALTVLVIAVGAATLTLALGVARLADNPWQRTFDATNGAHVLAYARDPALLEPLERQDGVVASTGVLASTMTSFERDGRRIGVAVIGAPERAPDVAQPLVTDGSWLRSGGIVLERSFARYWDIRPGDRLELATTTGRLELEATGIAVTASQERYPEGQPGAAFVRPDTLRRIQPTETSWDHLVGLRLADPAQSGAFVQPYQDPSSHVFAEDWQEMRTGATENARTNSIILTTFAVFLLLASGFVIANQVGARVLAQVREIGLLKAVGLTPAQVGAAFVIQHLLLGLAAVVLGAVAGALAAPFFLGPSSELLDASATPIGPAQVALVVVAVELVVALVAFLPAWRASRRPTMEALAGGRRGAARRSWLGRAAVRLRLPMAIVVGAKDAFARRGRSALTAASLVFAVMSAVAALAMEASFVLEDQRTQESLAEVRAEPLPGVVGPDWDFFDDQSAERAQFRLIVYGLDVVIMFVAFAGLLATAVLAVRERVRDLGILKAVGLTPSQVQLSVVSSHGVLGLLAAAVGIPVGIAFFFLVYWLVNGSTTDAAIPPWWQLGLLAPGVVLLVALVCWLPARIAARLPVVEALRYE